MELPWSSTGGWRERENPRFHFGTGPPAPKLCKPALRLQSFDSQGVLDDPSSGKSFSLLRSARRLRHST